MLAVQITIIVVCDQLGKATVKKYSAELAYVLIKARTIAPSGLCINVVELLCGKSIIYKSRR